MSSVLAILALSSTLDAANREILLRKTFWAVAWVESRGDPKAHNKPEDAAGIIQIRPIMLADANRIIGYDKWSLADRFDAQKSYEIFRLVVRHYHPNGTPEQWVRCWNGGGNWRKHSHLTDHYWRKVRAQMQKTLPHTVGHAAVGLILVGLLGATIIGGKSAQNP
jgi:hypothetical protein